MTEKVDTRIRARFHAALEPLTQPITRPNLARSDSPHHRTLNFVVGAVGFAAVAAGAGAFGLELSGHGRLTSPPFASRSTSASQSLASPDPSGGLAFAYTGNDGRGAASLTIQGLSIAEAYYVVSATCSGPGSVEIVAGDGTTLTRTSCTTQKGGALSNEYATHGLPIPLHVEADPATTWHITVYTTNQSPFPRLPSH